MKRTLPPEVKAALAMRGTTFAEWCRTLEVSTSTVYDVVSGRISGTKGKSRKVREEMERMGWKRKK